jgi:hypothetical protein
MSFENPIESYTKEQAMGKHDIEMGILPRKVFCWGEPEKKQVVIPCIKPIIVKEEPDDVIKDLESQQIPVIKKAMSVPLIHSGNVLMDFISNGTKEFEKRTGRPMTYAEMRAAWG